MLHKYIDNLPIVKKNILIRLQNMTQENIKVKKYTEPVTQHIIITINIQMSAEHKEYGGYNSK